MNPSQALEAAVTEMSEVIVAWDREQQVVTTLGELDALLDRLHERFAQGKRRVLVVLDRAASRAGAMAIGLGGEMAMLHWLVQDPDGTVHEDLLSLGDTGASLDGEEYVEFEYGETSSEFDPSVLVPLEVAREAARYYGATGQRPGSVRWQQA